MDNTLGLIQTALSIIGILVAGAVWVIVLVSRVSVKVSNLERDINILKETAKKLEDKTSFEHSEEVTKRVMLQVIHSEEFKNSLKTVLLHIDRNRSVGELSMFNEILHQLQELKAAK